MHEENFPMQVKGTFRQRAMRRAALQNGLKSFHTESDASIDAAMRLTEKKK